MENNSKRESVLTHAGVSVSSEANARAVFEDLFGFARAKSFEAGADLMKNLFHVERAVLVIVYGAGPAAIEVFVTSGNEADSVIGHVCIEVKDSAAIIERARGMGFEIRTHARLDGSDIVFIKDTDGNLYEIK
jgi:catechol 2,3-dioxygenase-like lactoylglutathione lyase family enzyme